ncbi:MAG: hypothetical protein OSB47_11495, partial [Pirellulaceae bacterium]|nr:hypothetical protein [Pirellulaceae bacterium]
MNVVILTQRKLVWQITFSGTISGPLMVDAQTVGPSGKKLLLSLASGNNIPLRYKEVKEICVWQESEACLGVLSFQGSRASDDSLHMRSLQARSGS